MLHLHIHFHGNCVHPQLGQQRAQVITLLLETLNIHDLPPRLVLLVARVVVNPHLRKDESVLWRPRRSDGHGGWKDPGIARYGSIVLLTLDCQLLELLLVLELHLVVVLDVLTVSVHG